MGAGEHQIEPLVAGAKYNADFQTGTALKVAGMKPADGKSGVLMRRAPGLLELAQRYLDSRMLIVAQMLQRLEEPLGKAQFNRHGAWAACR